MSLSAAVKQDGLSRATYDAVLRLRERAGFKGTGTRGMYLCHTFCEVGATPLADGLKDIHDFLVLHPGQVMVVINQDSVTPADFVKAVGHVGLARYVSTPPNGSSWPTLRTMIDDDRRLLILAENHAARHRGTSSPTAACCRTPYAFNNASQLAEAAASCRDNRGPTGAPLFLFNKWVTTDRRRGPATPRGSTHTPRCWPARGHAAHAQARPEPDRRRLLPARPAL